MGQPPAHVGKLPLYIYVYISLLSGPVKDPLVQKTAALRQTAPFMGVRRDLLPVISQAEARLRIQV